MRTRSTLLQGAIGARTTSRTRGLIEGAHGGYLGSCAPRSNHGRFVSPANHSPDIVVKNIRSTT